MALRLSSRRMKHLLPRARTLTRGCRGGTSRMRSSACARRRRRPATFITCPRPGSSAVLVPTIEEQQDHYVLEFAIIWFTAGNVFIMGPVLWWAKKYRMAHDHYPWGPPRLDGSKGPGGFVWFWE